MRIRKFQPDDREEKKQLHLQTIEEVNSKDYSEEQIKAWTTFDDSKAINEQDIERWVAVEDEKIVGFADYQPNEEKITGVYVHHDHLRKGIGSKLLGKIEEDARKRGISKLSCTSSVTAKRFYESNGYHIVEKKFHETSGEKLEAFVMEKSLG